MREKSAKATLRIIGSIYGIFGIYIIAFIAWFIASGEVQNLTLVQIWTNIPSGILRSVFFIAVAWLCWVQSKRAGSVAWASLFIFIFAALLDAIFNYGLGFIAHLIPTFYVVVLAQVTGASLLTYINRKYLNNGMA